MRSYSASYKLAAMTCTTDILRRLRAVPLSQSEISRLTGIPQPRISRWEAGQVPRVADDVLKLQALETTYTKKTKPKKAPALVQQALAAINTAAA